MRFDPCFRTTNHIVITIIRSRTKTMTFRFAEFSALLRTASIIGVTWNNILANYTTTNWRKRLIVIANIPNKYFIVGSRRCQCYAGVTFLATLKYTIGQQIAPFYYSCNNLIKFHSHFIISSSSSRFISDTQVHSKKHTHNTHTSRPAKKPKGFKKTSTVMNVNRRHPC